MIELPIKIVGETMVLHHERALWWPAQRALLLADVHLGKGSVLRRAGMAVPTGQTVPDLCRITQLIGFYRARQVVVLGDLVHGAAPPDAPWITQTQDWRRHHANVRMRLVAGNHDRHFDVGVLGFEVIAEELAYSPFVLRHCPGGSPRGYVLAGHIHPGITVRDGWRRHRLPAFRFDRHGGLLPAFGSLTGLHETRAGASERIIAVTPAGLLPVTLPGGARA